VAAWGRCRCSPPPLVGAVAAGPAGGQGCSCGGGFQELLVSRRPAFRQLHVRAHDAAAGDNVQQRAPRRQPAVEDGAPQGGGAGHLHARLVLVEGGRDRPLGARRGGEPLIRGRAGELGDAERQAAGAAGEAGDERTQRQRAVRRKTQGWPRQRHIRSPAGAAAAGRSCRHGMARRWRERCRRCHLPRAQRLAAPQRRLPPERRCRRRKTRRSPTPQKGGSHRPGPRVRHAAAAAAAAVHRCGPWRLCG
jgi:hypothetical protein